MNQTGIGQRTRRLEDPRLVRGRGRYVADIKLPGMQEVSFYRSPLAHAEVVSVVKPEGYEQNVLTAHDLVGLKPILADSTLPSFQTSVQWPLAKDKARFAGEAIVVCIAQNRAEAEDLVELTQVNLKPLKPIMTHLEAKESQEVRVHEHWDNNMFLDFSLGQDFADIKAQASVVVEREYQTARQVMNPMECKGVVAHWDHRDEQLVVYTSTQVPHLIRNGLADCLDISADMIRIITPEVGGGFGYKCILQPEEVVVAWLALNKRGAFRWIEDRREHLTAGANTREHHYKVTAYADDKGKLLGLQAEITVDVGAYSVWPFTAGLEAAQAGGNLPGPYAFDFYQCNVKATATNKPPFTPYRGVARPGVCFAIELTIDAIARAVGREAWQVRLENLIPESAMPYVNVTNKHYDSGDYPESLRRAQAAIGFERIRQRQKTTEPDGRLIGVGFATYTEQSAHGTQVFAQWGLPLVPGFDEARVKITPSGTLELSAGIANIGQGIETTLAQIASEILSIPIQKIKVTLGDTTTTPYSTGAYASRGIVMSGGAVSKAAQGLAERIKALASHRLGCEPDDIVLQDEQIQSPQGSLSFAELAKSWYLRPDDFPAHDQYSGLEYTAFYKAKVDTGVFSYASHAVVVAVDPQTGKTELLDYVIVEDCGRVVNPMIVDGQAIGGTAQGIGSALLEEVLYNDQGQPMSSTLADYYLPGAAEVPHVQVKHMETLSPHTAHGIKGVGEGGAIAPGGAVINAINDALSSYGVELNRIPATPERVLSAILASQTTQQEATHEARSV